MSESSKRHSKFLSLIFILKCLSKASNIKVNDKQEKQVTHTYALIEAKIFMKATNWSKEKIDIIRW